MPNANSIKKKEMKKYNKENGRKNMRLRGYDYSRAGLYFLTPVLKNRAHLFGEIRRTDDSRGRPVMILNDAGRMVDNEWLKIADRFPNVVLHEYVVMPNHFHCIIEIVGDEERTTRVAPTVTVGDIIGAFQSITTVEYIRGVKKYGWQRFDGKLWQRNYYDHIIRNDKSYQNISEYIVNNPAKWTDDKFYNQ